MAKKKAAAKKTKKDKKPLTLAERRKKIRDRYDRPVVIYESDVEPPRITTRFAQLDALLGMGIKRGAIIEIYGFEDSAKTSLSISLAGDMQAASPKGKNHVVMVNFEMPQDYRWWRTLGLDVSDGMFTQLRPKTLEEGIGDMADLVQSGEVCCVIIDSVYAASAKDSKEILKVWQDPSKGGQQGAGGIGIEARQWGKAWTAIKGLFVEHDAVCIAVNQVREKVDGGGGKKRRGLGPKATTTPRGHALKFYAWVRLELRGSVLTDQDGEMRRDVDGRSVRIKVVKNKTSGDDRGVAWYDLIRNQGWDMIGDLLQLSLDAGAITGGGGGYYQIGNKQIRGKAKVRELIEGSVPVQEALRRRVDAYLANQVEEEIEDPE